MITSYGQTGHSASFSMQLVVNGSTLSIAQLGPDFLLLRDTMDHPPAEATIIVRVDANERRWTVNLPEGLTKASDRVRLA